MTIFERFYLSCRVECSNQTTSYKFVSRKVESLKKLRSCFINTMANGASKRITGSKSNSPCFRYPGFQLGLNVTGGNCWLTVVSLRRFTIRLICRKLDNRVIWSVSPTNLFLQDVVRPLNEIYDLTTSDTVPRTYPGGFQDVAFSGAFRENDLIGNELSQFRVSIRVFFRMVIQ